MALVEIASGGLGLEELMRLREIDNQFAEGERGAIKLVFREPLPQDTITTFVQQLEQLGVQMWDTVQSIENELWIFFTKAAPPLVLIGIAIGAVAVIAIMLLGWVIFKEGGTGIGGIGTSLLVGGAVLLGGLVLLNKLTR